MPTGQTIVNNSLITLGMLQQGGSPSVSDANDALAELNDLWDAWQIDDGLIYTEQATLAPLSATVASYAIGSGTGAAIVLAARPTKMFGSVAVYNSGGRSARRPMKIVNNEEYRIHGDLSAIATYPEEAYLDYNVDANGNAAIYFWPAPAVVISAELSLGAPFVAWQLGINTILPYAYQDAVNYVLAFRLIPRYGAAVDPRIVQVVTAAAEKAEGRIRSMNAANRKMPLPEQSQPNPQLQQALAQQTQMQQMRGGQ